MYGIANPNAIENFDLYHRLAYFIIFILRIRLCGEQKKLSLLLLLKFDQKQSNANGNINT